MPCPPSSSLSPAVRKALRRYLAVFLLLSVAGWLPEIAGRLGISWVSADYAALLHPSDSFGPPSAAFSDLTDFAPLAAHPSGATLAGLHLAPFPYLPAAALLMAVFLRASGGTATVYLVSFAAVLGAGAFFLARKLSRRAGALGAVVVAATVLCGSPQIFTANRANIEWVGCALTALAIACFLGERYLWAGVILGVAGAIKPFPLIFLILLLWRRRYREAVTGIAATVLISLAALVVLGPTPRLALHYLLTGWSEYFARYVLVIRTAQEFRFNHSLLDAVKVPVWFLFNHQQYDPRQLTGAVPGIPLWARMDLWARLNGVFAAAVLAWISVHFRRMPALNGIFAFTVAELLLPYGAGEYTLLLLYVPWALLLLAAAAGQVDVSAARLICFLLPCAALFTPLSFMNCLAGFSKTVLLVWLFLQALRTPLPSRWDHHAAEQVSG